MVKLNASEISKSLSRANPIVVLLAILSVFAIVVFVVTQGLRTDLHEHVLQREASSLEPLVQYQIRQAFDDVNGDLDEEDSLIIALLDTADIEGALSVQLFDRSGKSVFSLPANNILKVLEGEILIAMNSFEPMATFAEDGAAEERFVGFVDEGANGAVPILEVYIPIASPESFEIAGIARYVLDGRDTSVVFASIDADVTRQALAAFAGGGILISIIVLVSLVRLRRAYETLDAYAHRLEVANQDLDAVARTAAIGSVTSHLMHGLRNPLAGLRDYLKASDHDLDDEDRKDAQEAGRRMQALINEVLEVIRSNAATDSYKLNLDEFASTLKNKFKALARKKQLDLTFEIRGKTVLDSRIANVALLICSNLIQNAIDASSEGGAVSFEANSLGESVSMLVRDTGGGFSDSAKAQLFSPVQSVKPDGAGVGLTISSQLAKHIGASIELVSTGKEGSVLRLDLSRCSSVAVASN